VSVAHDEADVERKLLLRLEFHSQAAHRLRHDDPGNQRCTAPETEIDILHRLTASRLSVVGLCLMAAPFGQRVDQPRKAEPLHAISFPSPVASIAAIIGRS